MNGLKLGGNQKPKNSYAFENEFIDYGGAEDVQSESEDDDEDEDESEDVSDSYHAKQSSKEVGKLLIESNLKNNISATEIKNKPDEFKRIKKLNNGMQKLSVSILEMREKYKEMDMEEVLFKKRNQKKQAEIKSFLDEKHNQKRKLKKKMKLIREKERKKLEESINLEMEEKKSIPKKRVEEHLHKLEEIKQRRQAEKQKSAIKEQQVLSMYSKIHDQEKKKKKFHLRKMQEDTKKKIEQMQKQKQFLTKRKQVYKPLDYEKLEEHAQRHDQLLKQLESVKRAQKEQHFKSIVQKNAKFDELYRGNAYDFVAEQYEEKKLKRKQPKQKVQKMKNYQEYVRENFVPHTHQKPSKSLEMESNRSTHSHKQVKRYRYFQGESYGEIVEVRPLPKSKDEEKKIGNQNMAYMRSLPKRKKVHEVQEEINSQDLQILNNKLNAIVKVKREKNPLYERSGRKSLEVKVSDKPTRDELNMVIKQLKNKDDSTRMREKVIKNEGGGFADYSQKHREINQNIVDNIERKLNLLSKL